MTFTEHAEKWVNERGLALPDSDYDGMLGEAVLSLAKCHSQEGHSGMSAQLARAYFNFMCDSYEGTKTFLLNKEDGEAVDAFLKERELEDEKKARVEDRMELVEKIWNENANYLKERIEIQGDDAFKWNQLVWQEIWMWISLDDEVTEEELKEMSEIRGFNDKQEEFLREVLAALSLMPRNE